MKIQVRVTIEGVAGSGKTVASHAIIPALREAGFDVEEYDNDDPRVKRDIEPQGGGKNVLILTRNV